MRTINIMSGIPGSGKTTYIEKHAEWCDQRLHRDEFRDSLRDSLGVSTYFPVPANKEWELWMGFVNSILIVDNTKDIYIDQTTIGTGALAKLLKSLHLTKYDKILVHVFNIPLEVCLERNSKRTGMARVPDDVLQSMYTNFTSKLITKSTARRIAAQTNIEATIDVVFHNEVTDYE